jgi:beta-N-acetylhexosaminidase
MKPVIFGLSGEALTDEERGFFREVDPAGYILFKRNITNRDQVRALTDDLRGISGRADLAILIDQEGGRVARMQPPIWPTFPSAARFDALYRIAPMSAIEAARSNAEAVALTLSEVGINVNCMPVLDVRQKDTHDAIGDRSLGHDPVQVASLGRAVLRGLAQGGVVGVVKHIPGQGRASVDSHHDLPRVTATADELEADLLPFIRLNDAPMAMTGHIVFDAWDSARCSTLSPIVIEQIIRGRIGFDGLLMSDDLYMDALEGSIADRAAASLAAGCDVALVCHGSVEDMAAVAEALPDLADGSRLRLDQAMAYAATRGDVDRAPALIAKRDALLASAA